MSPSTRRVPGPHEKYPQGTPRPASHIPGGGVPTGGTFARLMVLTGCRWKAHPGCHEVCWVFDRAVEDGRRPDQLQTLIAATWHNTR